jgi:hypothetical protein
MYLFLLIVLSIVGITSPTHATTYYVSTTGDNANDGQETSPKLTVAHCVSIMVAGDTCYVRGGTYNSGAIVFTVSGTQALPIKLLNYPGESPVINFTAQTSSYRILIQNANGFNKAMGWITIEGFEIKNGYEGIKAYNIHDSTIRNNYVHHNILQGVLIQGSTRLLVERNIIALNGPIFTDPTSYLEHGLYGDGTNMSIRNNIFYGNTGFGIQQNGSSSSTYSATAHAGPEFASATGWIIESNTFAYNGRAGQVVWGSACSNARIENNIFYENGVNGTSGSTQGIFCTSCGSATGILIKNNHAYGSGSGALLFQAVGFHAGTIVTGNVVNVSAPAFVNGGSNSLPASPDFSLTASAPADIALVNEVPNNSTLVVGAFKPLATPTGSITTNKITLNFPMSTAGPILIPSATGLSVTCTPNPTACPGSPTIVAASRSPGTDAIIEVEIGGIAGNACLAGQLWKLSYSSTTGSWSDSALIGGLTGFNQKVFSFTDLAVTDLCTGSGPTDYPAGYHVYYKFNEGTGTSANDESANNLDGTLTNGPTWGAGKTGSGVVMTGNDTKHVAIPYGVTGGAVDPSTQSLTLAFGVNVEPGMETFTRGYAGSILGTNQRFYISTAGGTWRMGMQTHAASSEGSIAVTSGWHSVCLTADSGTNVATLYIDGIASTTTVSYTSFSLASDIELGRISGLSTGASAAYDDLLIYTSVEDCAAISAAFSASLPAVGGTFDQTTVQAQAVYLPSVGENPTNLVGLGIAKKVVVGGAVAWVFQIHCTNVADCDETAFRLAYRKNGAGSWQQVPDTETSDGIYMWGESVDMLLNAGTTTARLTGSCTVTNGVTLLTTAQVPSVDLPQDGCIMLRWIVRVGNMAGDYFELRVETEGGTAFTGSYTNARIDVIAAQSGGMGF